MGIGLVLRAACATALALLLAVPRSASAVEWIAPVGLTDAERRASDEILEDAARRLPPRWHAALSRPLRVEWRADLRADVHGHYEPGVVHLKRALLEGWMRSASPSPERRAATAALLHELAHAWDRSTGGSLSQEPRLLDLAGWQVAPLRSNARIARNDFRDRTPDAYELTNAREFLAVNLEHFVLDPEYACRRPALSRWFAGRTGAAPPGAACPPPVFARMSSDGDAASLLALEPSRIYQVDYLLAEPDTQPMSRWGHSMLRLVICAPGRAPGPACRLDIAHHVVLSFRAFVDDVQVSSWRGLSGGYPSRLFVLPMPQVIDEYTKVQLRGLRSVPLALSSAEVAALLERAAQVHWSYDGRYRFVTRNCAVETFRLLHDGVPRLADADLASLTPTGLLRRLERAGIADASPLRDREGARAEGYRFEAMDIYYQRLMDRAGESMGMAPMDVRDWLDRDPRERAALFVRTDVRSAAALLVLENAALRRVEQRSRDVLKRRLARSSSTSGRQLQDATADALATAASLAHPASLTASAGYGLPLSAEREAIARGLEIESALWRERWLAAREAGEAALGDAERAVLVQTRRNIEDLGARLRRLAALEHPAGSSQAPRAGAEIGDRRESSRDSRTAIVEPR